MEKNCFSFPGMYEAGRKQGMKEQRMIITRGPTGCLEGSDHRTLKYLALVAGKLNEHQRADRDNYIRLNSSALLPGR